MVGLSGGKGLDRHLDTIARKSGDYPEVRVGFLENTTYPDGTSLPLVAFVQEFGARIEVEPRTQTVYRKKGANGSFLRNGRFVKRRISNFSSDHYVGAHVIVIPPRPFFRRMIAEKSRDWPRQIAENLRQTNFDIIRSLRLMGDQIRGELKDSIQKLTDPKLADSTVRRKGFSKPLIDTGYMLRSVDYDVVDRDTRDASE